MSEEVKIVITLKGQTASIGVQKPDCDPFFSRVEGDLPAVLESVPGLVEEAQRSWDSNPRYPKCETPLTPQSPPITQRSTQRQPQAASQRPMF
ncbi:unnamed protein product [marine sediment metagenome]|uniref:Uncharacterized protein n=1 Tax=marine sediment metagenome TaxID=412755 RepID=X1TUQ1_9ZZZZ